MAKEFFSSARRIRARAVSVGERIDTRSLERGRALHFAPLTVPAGESGAAVLFRYGAVVFFGVAPIESFWLDPERRRTRTSAEHRDINEVMLATSLVPEGHLVLPPLA